MTNGEPEFLGNTWSVAAWDHELNDGKLLARTILGEPVLLYKGGSGRATALDDSMVEEFLEDKAIIEGQRGVLDADPTFRFLGIKADAALTHCRRTLDAAIEAERHRNLRSIDGAAG